MAHSVAGCYIAEQTSGKDFCSADKQDLPWLANVLEYQTFYFSSATDRARRPLGTSAVLRLTQAVKGEPVLRTLGALCRSAIVVILAPLWHTACWLCRC